MAAFDMGYQSRANLVPSIVSLLHTLSMIDIRAAMGNSRHIIMCNPVARNQAAEAKLPFETLTLAITSRLKSGRC
eukprot:scaffold433953_cov32-Prasinocladus_malaysianus.AAC.1